MSSITSHLQPIKQVSGKSCERRLVQRAALGRGTTRNKSAWVLHWALGLIRGRRLKSAISPAHCCHTQHHCLGFRLLPAPCNCRPGRQTFPLAGTAALSSWREAPGDLQFFGVEGGVQLSTWTVFIAARTVTDFPLGKLFSFAALCCCGVCLSRDPLHVVLESWGKSNREGSSSPGCIAFRCVLRTLAIVKSVFFFFHWQD